MEKALKETESSVFCAKRSPNTETKSNRVKFFSFPKRERNTRSKDFRATSERCFQKKNCLKVGAQTLFRENFRYLRRKCFPPVIKSLCIRMIVFYQKYLSRHNCMYEPTCSEYTKRCINNLGVVVGILLGTWRILRCNPLSKGGFDPAPENPFRKRWLI